MKEGDYYIVCDFGGGTGDIVTHLIGTNKNVNEICASNGWKFGSNEINLLYTIIPIVCRIIDMVKYLYFKK